LISAPSWVPLATLLNNPDNAEQLAKHRKNAHAEIERYARLRRETAPPIWISRDGKILDGHHRALAAELRGDRDILACVISEG